jgi:hypothetical protein
MQTISIGTGSLPSDGHQNPKEAREKHSLDPLTSAWIYTTQPWSGLKKRLTKIINKIDKIYPVMA